MLRTSIAFAIAAGIVVSIGSCSPTAPVADEAPKSPTPLPANSVPPASAPAAGAAAASPASPADAAGPAKKPAPVRPIVKSWDFAKLEQPQWEWLALNPNPQKSPFGLFIGLDGEKPVLRLSNAGIDSQAVDLVKVTVRVGNDEANRLPPEKVVLYWTNAAQLADADPKWPFQQGRHVPLTQTKNDPFVWTAQVAKHPEWNGKLQEFFISIRPSAQSLEGRERVSVFIHDIQFLGAAAARPAAARKQ